MAAQTPFADPYDAVLADLQAKRDQIDQTIRLLESMRTSGGSTAPLNCQAAATSADDPGAFLGMSIPEAAKRLLASKKRSMTNGEISAALQAGGLAMTSADPSNTIGSVLTRRFHQIGDIVRVDRGTWGLKEWYPNRHFRAPAKAGDAKAETSAPVPPSEPRVDTPEETSAQPERDRLSVHQGGLS